MQTTPNYFLNKPDATDMYNIEVFNQNADKIDSALKRVSDEISATDQSVLYVANRCAQMIEDEAKPYTDAKVEALVDGAPDGYDTLGKIVDWTLALNNNMGNRVDSQQTEIDKLFVEKATKTELAQLREDVENMSSDVTVTPALTSGTKIGTITVDGTNKDLYAPNGYTHPAYTALTGAPTSNQTPAFGGTFSVSQPVSDATGHVTSLTNRTVKIPNSIATSTANGLMSSTDKAKLDGVAEGANAYTHPTYTARTGVPTANATPSFGSTFSVSQPVTDGTGHVTALTSRTVKIPNSVASDSANGLMSSADKTKLDGIASGANAYTHPSYTARTGVPTANQTPAFGGTFTVSQPVSDATGHITGINSRTITIPSATATTSANGLMSSTDKTNLDSAVTKLGKLQPHPYSLAISTSTGIGALTTTQTTYTNVNNRKFSDYGMLVVTIGASNNDVRETLVIPRTIFDGSDGNGAGRTFYLDCWSNNGQTYNQCAIKYVSDTSFIAYAVTSGTVVKYMNVYGIKVDDTL